MGIGGIEPHLPPAWQALRFPFVWAGEPLRITVEHGRVAIEHRGRRPLPVAVNGKQGELSPGETSVFDF